MADIYLVSLDDVREKFQVGTGRYYEAEEIEACPHVHMNSIGDIDQKVLSDLLTKFYAILLKRDIMERIENLPQILKGWEDEEK